MPSSGVVSCTFALGHMRDNIGTQHKHRTACTSILVSCKLHSRCQITCAALAQELKDFQRDGHSLEDLWKVAKGDIKYQDFVGSSIPRKGKEARQAAPTVPEDLVSPHKHGTLEVGLHIEQNMSHLSVLSSLFAPVLLLLAPDFLGLV